MTRASLRAKRQQATVGAGAGLARAGRRLLLRPWKNAIIDLPPAAVGRGARIDVVDDLVAYTRLERETVLALLQRRLDSFRAEWHLLPPPLRRDDWFYLSSTTYLFGNATHDPAPLLACFEEHVSPKPRALDYGGGAGNLAVTLALRGWEVDYLERSALQKDFVAFRRDRHGLDTLHVLDYWQPLSADEYDVVCAFDVFEHVEDLEDLLRDELLPSVKVGGLLAEWSPFIRNLSNPMHHEHRTLDATLSANGFQLEAEYSEVRVWRRINVGVASRSDS